MSGLELLRQRRKDIEKLAEQHGANNVRVFGSFVRQEERPDSDIDFLIHLQPGRTYFDYLHLVRALENLLHRRVDIVLDTTVKESLQEEIFGSAVEL